MQPQAHRGPTEMQTDNEHDRGRERSERSTSVEETERLQAQRNAQRTRYLDSEREYTARLDITLQGKRAENASLQQNVAQLTTENSLLSKDRDAWKAMFEALEPVQGAQRAKLARLEERIKLVETEREISRDLCRRLEEEKSSIEVRIEEVSADRESFKGEAQAVRDKLTDAQKEKAEAEVRLRTAIANLQDFKDQLADRQEEVESVRATSTAQQSKLATLDEALKQVTSDYDTLRTNANSTAAQLAKTRSVKISADNVVSTLRSEMELLRSQLAELENEHDELQDERDEWIAEATRQNRSARKQLALNEALSAHVKRLEKDLEMKDRVREIEEAEMGRKILELQRQLSVVTGGVQKARIGTQGSRGERCHNHSADFPFDEDEEQDVQPLLPQPDPELQAVIQRRIIVDATLREMNERLESELDGVYQERHELLARLRVLHDRPTHVPETEDHSVDAAVAQLGCTPTSEYDYPLPKSAPSSSSVVLTSPQQTNIDLAVNHTTEHMDRPTSPPSGGIPHDRLTIRMYSTASRTLGASDSTIMATGSVDDRQRRDPSADDSTCSDNTELMLERLREEEEPNFNCGWDTDDMHRDDPRQSSEELSDQSAIARGVQIYRQRFAPGDNGSASEPSDRSSCGSEWTDDVRDEGVKFGGTAGDRAKYRAWSKCWNVMDGRQDLDEGYDY
ncbi:hypothetical protein QFC20_006773 [Naganishia adeliensis]|uniref:Uncharacterized protein n=1 Tax=Naganishia adeliensis TaxID=92952 RepID=A0ACC2V6D3_9TREE|nr:hypothetical protein QFC20_006773 [Naganishia adeliensis]